MPTLRENALEWCQEDRSYFWRLPLLAYGVFIAFKIIGNSDRFSPIDFLDLAIHEMGHVAFAPLGMWMGIAGGSLAQLLAPLYGIWQFHRQRDYFAAAFGLAWLGESMLNLSHYVADARKQELPLVNLFGGDPIHDWNYLLGSMNRLSSDIRYANSLRFFAFLFTLIFLWIGSWLIWQIFLASRQPNT